MSRFEEQNKQEIRGIVGFGPINRPTKVTGIDKKEVRFFTIQYHDRTWKDDNGKRQYNRKFMKVFLPKNSYGESIFKNLYSGRQIIVLGNVNLHKREYQKDGETKFFAELQMSDATVDFIDQPLWKQIDNILEIAEDKKMIDPDGAFTCTATELKQSILDYVSDLSGVTVDNSETPSTEESEADEQFAAGGKGTGF